jgi:prevent-host-death family protein
MLVHYIRRLDNPNRTCAPRRRESLIIVVGPVVSSPPLDEMTRCDYLLVMKKVRIAELKARLSEHLRAVRRGETYTVMDRQTPIARLLPYGAEVEPLRVRKPMRRVPTLQDVALPPPLKIDVDPVALLLEERQVER